jgi:hypothetical protein
MKLLDIIFEDENKEKLIKRGKIIYKGFKTGTVRKGHFGKITYELPDVYDIQIDVHNEIFIEIGKNRSDNEIKFFYIDGTGGEIKPYSLNNTEYNIFVKEISVRKFKSFNIILWYNHSEDIVQPINEDAEKGALSLARAEFVNRAIILSAISTHFYLSIKNLHDSPI